MPATRRHPRTTQSAATRGYDHTHRTIRALLLPAALG